MQTVPSLIGSGTAVAAAATGLVFGQQADGQVPATLRKSNSSKRRDSLANIFSSRPGTTFPTSGADESLPLQNTTNQPRVSRRSSQQQNTPPKSSTWRNSFAKQTDFAPTASIAEDPRDSTSSQGSSWMRRLSIRPISQHGSLRSSVGPDSPSIFSFGSGAPILPSGLPAPPLPPNKLVKRSSTRDGSNHGSLVSRGSRSQMPTLRRPATSHQRSATLQQMTADAVGPVHESSFESQTRPRAQTFVKPARGTRSGDAYGWKSFFHARLARISTKVSPIRGDGGVPPSAKRICVEQDRPQRAYLVEPNAIMPGAAPVEMAWEVELDVNPEIEGSPQSSQKSGESPTETPPEGPRRSISMHFSSPTNWISKSGSIRRRKRGAPPAEDVGASANKRHVSEPIPQANGEELRRKPAMEELGSRADEPSKAESDLAAIFHPPSRERNKSSPLPPLSRLSSFHIDLHQLGSSSSRSQGKPDEATAGINSLGTLRVNSNGSQARTLDRASTVASSEYHRGFTSGDDDTTDFNTDTPFDSIRTTTSGRKRGLDSPIESMFDESPPSTAGHNSKPKRLSIQEILGPSFDGGHKIMEEDEGMPTPVRATHRGTEPHFRLASSRDDNDGFRYTAPSPEFALANTEFGRLSLDDDDDDWTREDELPVYNSLSPPSSMTSRRGSPNLRLALASISGNSKSELCSQFDACSERPRSNIFDWAEPLHHDKLEINGHSPRPKTVHGKQEMDIRGGRSASRKGPTAAHVRSQSVPVVPDPADTSKSTQKFGTWGLGQKNVSEDWDDDFEFEEEMETGPTEGNKAENRVSMIVPASIQATQPTVKAHSGQIRELSLLVNDLKRLCRLGREMDLLGGPSYKLWREAEGIIALASPDEDEAENSSRNAPGDDFDPASVDSRFVDEGFDGKVLELSEQSSDNAEQVRNAVVKERPMARRRSVFSPDDEIFGNWPQVKDEAAHERPITPVPKAELNPYHPSSVARSLMESMHLRRRQPTDSDDEDASNGRLNFDTNSLKELVKRAGDLRDALSDVVRKVDRITHSPAHTPRRNRSEKNGDGSPAFTRVFDDPATPTRILPHSRSTNSVLSGGSVSASPSTNGLSQRMQMMTVS